VVTKNVEFICEMSQVENKSSLLDKRTEKQRIQLKFYFEPGSRNVDGKP
jgi:hypothetical protein